MSTFADLEWTVLVPLPEQGYLKMCTFYCMSIPYLYTYNMGRQEKESLCRKGMGMLVKLQSPQVWLLSSRWYPIAAQACLHRVVLRRGGTVGSFKWASKGQETPRPFTLQETQGLLQLRGN